METARMGEPDQPTRGFLLSEPKAILQTIIPQDDESDSEDLPSTVDIEALKEPLLSVSEDPIHMGQWRNNAAPRIKPKAFEVPKRDQQVPNGLETESHSEKSRDTDGSSSDSDTDSDSGSGTGSSSSDSSCNSSVSSDSSESDSDSQSNKSSSCHSLSMGVKKSTPSRLSLPSKTYSKDTHSRSNSSTSSRSRKSKQFSISQSTYEPGSLKLKIAALKLPPMQHQPQPSKDPDQKQLHNNEARGAVENKIIADGKITNTPKGSTESVSDDIKVNSDENRTNSSLKPSMVTPVHMEVEKTANPEPRRSSRCTSRGKSFGESASNVDGTPLVNGTGLGSSLQCSTVPTSSKSKRINNEMNSRCSSLSDVQPSSFPSVKEYSKDPVTPRSVQKHGLTSSLNDNVTMTVNNGYNVTPKRNPRTPTNSASVHGINSMYQIRTGNINGTSMQSSEHSILDPVLRLTKNSDLTIFAINPPKPCSSNKSSANSIHSWNTNNQDLVMITATGTTTPNNQTSHNIQSSSPLRSSRRLSAQRRSIDKSDFESWDSTDASAAVQAAIQRIDSEVTNNSKIVSTSGPPSGSSVVGSSSHSSTSKKYNSTLLEKFTEMLTAPQGNVSPKIGDVSIEPIIPPKPSSCIKKNTGSHNVINNPNSLVEKEFLSKRQKEKQRKKSLISGTNVIQETTVKITRISAPKPDYVDLSNSVNHTRVKLHSKAEEPKENEKLLNGKVVIQDKQIPPQNQKINNEISKSGSHKHKKNKQSPNTQIFTPPVEPMRNNKHGHSELPSGNHEVYSSKSKSAAPKIKQKLNKLSIFAPPGSSRQAKLLRSNGKLMPQTTIKVAVKRGKSETMSQFPKVSAAKKLEKEPSIGSGLNIDEDKCNLKPDFKTTPQTPSSMTKEKEIKNGSNNRIVNNSKRDVISPAITVSCVPNGQLKSFTPIGNTIPPQLQEKPNQSMPIMVKTKGAKKYIPENENLLVTPQQCLPTSTTVSSGVENETLLLTMKKKSKKSRAKDKKDKDKNKGKKQKISFTDLQTLDDLCSGINNVVLKGSPSNSANKANKKHKKQRFTFEKMIFKNIFTPLIPNNEIPPPQYDTSVNKSQTRTQQQLRSYNAKSGPNILSVRKRKNFNERNSTGDVSDTTLSDSSSANTSSSDLQKLPLKKRHHHTPTTSSSASGKIHSVQEFKVNVDNEQNRNTLLSLKSLSANTSRHKFGARSNWSSKLVAPVGLVNTQFGKIGSAHKKGEKVVSGGSKDKSKLEKPGIWVNLDFGSIANKANVDSKQKITVARKESHANKKDSEKASVKQSNSSTLEDSADSQTEKRRSNRVRKPRILDGEILESPTKLLTRDREASTSKAIKPEIRELASKIEATITPVINESMLLLTESPTVVRPSDFSNTGESNGRSASRKRLRSSVNGVDPSIGETAGKRIKVDGSGSIVKVDGNGAIVKVPKPEPELITLDDDDDVVEIELENPDVQSGIEIVLTQTSVPLPLISPTSSTGIVKKRRKVNKTGFPATKKKKKSYKTNISAILSNETAVSTSGVESIDAESDGVIIVNEVSTSRRKKSSTRKSTAVMENQFSSSLTERVKIRKRNSVDGNGGYEDGSDGLEVPGISPALINIPDAPIIIPEKNNLLQAGLLSNFYKQSGLHPRGKKHGRKPVQATGNVLPPPAYCAQFVRQRVVDYTLPYDIWCLGVIRAKEMLDVWREEQRAKEEAEAVVAKAEKLKNRRSSASTSSSVSTKPAKIPMPEIIPPSWNFKKIKSNVYFGLTKPPASSEFDQLCLCSSDDEQKCSADDCLNRVVYSECPPICGEKCTNRRIQKHDWNPFIKRILTQDKGYGVFTFGQIKKGEFILEYVGEVVPDALFKERMHTIYANDTHHYCLQLDGGLVIDGHRAGGEGRFVNHSCEPNCEMQKWVVQGLSRMALFALRDIEEGEELSYDYNFSLFNPAEGQPCHCGSTKCRGVIGGRTKTLKNDPTGTSKRKTKTNVSGIKENVTGTIAEINVLDKMKVLTKKERVFIQKHQVFLVRNYYKIRQSRGEVEDKVGHRLEKIMLSWANRYKAGSDKIKPLILPEDDPELSRMARIAQILYVMFSKLTTARDDAGNSLSGPFMLMPQVKKCPQFYEMFEKGQEPMDFSVVKKKILQGEYKTLIGLENDLATVMSSFCQAYEKEKPNLPSIVDKIKALYMSLKVKVVSEMEPFIVVNGKASELPEFVKWEQKPTDDVIRCICETFSEEGMMIQCEKCLVWQHADCVRVPQSQMSGTQDGKRRRKGKGKSKESRIYAVTPLTSPFNNPKSKTPSPVVANAPLLQGSGESEVEMEDLVINVKDELPLMIFDNSVANDQETSEKNEIKPPGSVSKLPSTSINEMETQLIEDDVLLCGSPLKPVVESANDSMITPKKDLTPQKENLTGGEIASSSQENTEAKSAPNQSETYFCERCSPRDIDVEVPLDGGHDTPDKKHFLCLIREDGLMLHKNDTVYVLRDSTPEKKAELENRGKDIPRLTYQNAGELVPKECDIFRIEALWKDPKGARFVFGYHYLRPNETFHEPSRRFYPNEILRAPIFEVIAIDLIHGRCWVVDPATYCKGRPLGCQEDHLYICEYRVDKQARSFSKVGKNSQSVCIKPFAFQYFENRLKIQRNIHPHGPPSPDFRVKPANAPTTSGTEKSKSKKTSEKSGQSAVPNTLERLNLAKRISSKKYRVNKLLDKLHVLVPGFTDGVDGDLHLLQAGRKKPSKKFSIH